MPNNNASLRLVLLLAIAPACGGTHEEPVGETSGGSSSGTSEDAPTTTTTTTTATTTSTSTTAAEVTSESSSSEDDGSSDGGETSSTSDASSSSGGDDDDDSESSSSSGGVEPPDDGTYDDCANVPEEDACDLAAGESCLNGPGGAAFCTIAECTDVDDCPVPTSGDAPVVCGELSAGIPYCYMSCAEGQACPDGMECVAELCAWTLQAPGGGVCPDAALASELPQMYAGTNDELYDDVLPSCAPGGAEALLEISAPQDGTYRITTAGSAFDTVLVVMDGCDGEQLACNDDGEGLGYQSAIEIALVAEQSIVIAVDGFDGAIGEFTLDIALVP